jgi:molybdopterin synthase sulfur carrier subunit
VSLVTVRYWAAARAAAGVVEDKVDAANLAEALDRVREMRAGQSRFAHVLAVCSYIVDGTPVGTRPHDSVPLNGGAEIEVLPPFAGGSPH